MKISVMHAGRAPARRKGYVFQIKYKLLACLLVVVVAVMAATLMLTYYHTAGVVQQRSEMLLRSENETVVQKVDGWMNSVLASLSAEREALKYFDMDSEGILQYLKYIAGKNDAYPTGMFVGLATGEMLDPFYSTEEGFVVTERPWYQQGIVSENISLGRVYVDSESGSYVVGAAGMYKNNRGQVLGVVSADIYLNTITEIVRDMNIEESGITFLAEVETGTIIGHQYDERVGVKLSAVDYALYDYLSSAVAERTEGLSTFDSKSTGQIEVYISYIEDCDWAVVSYVPRSEILRSLDDLTRQLIFFAVIATMILLMLIWLVIRIVIDRPLRQIQRVATSMANGNLKQSIHVTSNDEFGQLSEQFGQTVSRLRKYTNYINEVAIVLNQIAVGKLDFVLQYDYSGDFAHVRHAMEHIADSLNKTLCQINQAANEVSAGAAQIASGSYTLAQGTTEQSGSVQEMVERIDAIAQQVQSNAEDAGDTSHKVFQLGEGMSKSSEKMHEMVHAMQEIQDFSTRIASIVKIIEDIAYQTNILALNASIESTRSGTTSQGFSVVADEVRSLAAKSQEAAQDVTALIESAIKSIAHGSQIMADTSQTLQQAVDFAKEMEGSVERISAASGEQATSIIQVKKGIEEISQVVQLNSATAQEAAAASQQLSAQARMLKELVGQFTLIEKEEAVESIDEDAEYSLEQLDEIINSVTSISLNP